MDLLELVPDAVKRATAQGVEAAEAFGLTFATRSVYVEDDVPKVAEERSETGLGLRVAGGRHVAFASTTLAAASDLKPVVDATMAGLRSAPEDPEFSGFTAEAGRGSVDAVWDARTAEAGVEAVLEAAKTFTDAVRERKTASVPKAVIRMQDYALRVANSNGVEAGHRGTLVFGYLTATCGSGAKVGEGVLKALGPSLRGIDFAALGATVARRAAENLHAKAFKEKVAGTAILDPVDLGEMILQSVGSALNGENVYRKRSAWAGKVGQEVGSAALTIRDKPRMPGGLASCAADDEGVATHDRTLVQAGILKGFLADHYHGRLTQQEPGNGFRRAVATVEGAYARPASTHASNLVVEPGTKSLEDLIAEVDRGVYVEKVAAPEVNEFSGTFGSEVRNATIIEKGELTDHVKYALLSGNLYEGLKNVAGIGRIPTWTHGFLNDPGSAFLPPVAFDGFELVGQK